MEEYFVPLPPPKFLSWHQKELRAVYSVICLTLPSCGMVVFWGATYLLLYVESAAILAYLRLWHFQNRFLGRLPVGNRQDVKGIFPSRPISNEYDMETNICFKILLYH